MPTGGPSSVWPVSTQLGPTSQAATTGKNFREIVGQVLSWNPDLPITACEDIVRDTYRKIIDRRLWFGMMVRGEVTVPDMYSTGSVSVVNGSATVTGVGTNFTSDMIGRQFRIGLTQGTYYTIATFVSPTQITLSLPWGSSTQSGVSYQIFQALVSFGYNVKKLRTVLNTRNNRRMWVDLPQDVIDAQDPQRAASSWPRVVAQTAYSQDGQPLFELYPKPTTAQAFPFLAYIQPPDLVEDSDYPLPFVRSDVIVAGAIPDAIMFRGKNGGKYYDTMIVEKKMKEFESELLRMALNDNNLFQSDLIWDMESWPMCGGGPDYAQSTDM